MNQIDGARTRILMVAQGDLYVVIPSMRRRSQFWRVFRWGFFFMILLFVLVIRGVL